MDSGSTSVPIVGGSSIHAGVVDIDVQLTVDQQVIAFENHEIAESACPLVEVPTLWRTRYKPCLTAKLLQNVYHNVLFYYWLINGFLISNLHSFHVTNTLFTCNTDRIFYILSNIVCVHVLHWLHFVLCSDEMYGFCSVFLKNLYVW